MKCESGEDGECVGSQMCDCAGWKLWGWDTGHDKSSHAGCTDTWHCHVIPSRDTATGDRHWIPSQGTVPGNDKSSRAGEADGAMAEGHGTSLPGTAWTWHCDIRDAHGDNCEVQ